MANVDVGMPRFWIALCLLTACHRTDAVPTPAPTPPAVAPVVTPDAAPAPVDVELVISEFHFETGTQFVHIDAKGHIDDVMASFDEIDVKKFCKAPAAKDKQLCAQLKGEKTFMRKFWRHAQYDATAAEVDDLRARLAAADLPKLDAKYTGDNGDDGVTTTYRLTTGGTTTTVSAYGTGKRGEPPKLLEVFRWMRAEQDAHEAVRKAAPALEEADYATLAKQWGVSS